MYKKFLYNDSFKCVDSPPPHKSWKVLVTEYISIEAGIAKIRYSLKLVRF
jgi:hypothetical protein